jgi:hypothetical protein
MLSYLETLRRSLLVAFGFSVFDVAAAYLLTLFRYSFTETIGDFILIEVAFLFILAGLLDFGSSIGMAQVRKVILGSKEEYSSAKHKDTERKALVFLFAGIFLFLALTAIAVYNLGRT